MQQALDLSSDAVAGFDRGRRITVWNASMARLTGVPAQRALGGDAGELLRELDGPGDGGSGVDSALAGREAIARERRYASNGGTCYLDGRIAPARGGDGEVLGGWAIFHDVTERVAWQRLGGSQKELSHWQDQVQSVARQMADALPGLVWVVDLAGNALSFNRQLYQYTGWPEGSLRRDAWREFMHPEDVARAQKERERAVGSNGETRAEFRLKCADGSYRWHVVRSLPIRDESGEVRLRVGSAEDISAQKLAEEARRHSEARFRAVCDQTAMALQILSREGAPLYANQGWAQLLGLRREGSRLLEAPELEALGVRPLVPMVLQGETVHVPPRPVDLPAAEAGGPPRSRWLELFLYPVFEVEGEVRELAVQVHDVTELVRAHQRIEASERRAKEAVESQQRWLEQALDRIPVPLAFLEPGTGRTLFANQAMRQMADPAALDAPTAGLRPGLAEAALRAARAAEGEGLEGDYVVVRMGKRELALLVDSVQLPSQHGHERTVLVSCRDVSSLVHAQSELKQAVHARDEFLSVASHELRTPLTSLKLQTALARRGGGAPREHLLRLIQQVDRQVDRLARLVEDMLDISRISTGRLTLRPERFDLGQLLSEALERFAPERLSGVGDVRLSAPPEPVVGFWDRVRIEQVINNLLSNATRYGDGKPVLVKLEKRQGRAELSVQDFGRGIAPADQARIFERYERAVPASEVSGMGLGLFIARHIVEAHGGTIGVTSTPGAGATFRVALPLV